MVEQANSPALTGTALAKLDDVANPTRLDGLLETLHLTEQAPRPGAKAPLQLGAKMGGAPIAVPAPRVAALPGPAASAPPAAKRSFSRGRIRSGPAARAAAAPGGDEEVLPLGPQRMIGSPGAALVPIKDAAPAPPPLGAARQDPRSAREGRVFFDRRAFCVEPERPIARRGRALPPSLVGGGELVSREANALSQLQMVVRRLAEDVADREHAMGGKSLADHRTPRAIDWRAAKAPSRAEFEAIAAEAFDALPEAFRARCDGVAILVQDFAEREQLESLGIANEFELMGLYEGVDLTLASGLDAPQDLNRVFLFRRPLLDYWAEHDETLGHLITHVLVHEIGHHFGLSDEMMQAIEDAAG